jgi:hypothetical protein
MSPPTLLKFGINRRIPNKTNRVNILRSSKISIPLSEIEEIYLANKIIFIYNKNLLRKIPQSFAEIPGGKYGNFETFSMAKCIIEERA